MAPVAVMSTKIQLYIREAGDGAIAVKEMQSFPCGLIIVDWKMEPLDGLDFVRLVRTFKDSTTPSSPSSCYRDSPSSAGSRKQVTRV